MRDEDHKDHILIVDDDAALCRLLKRYLEEHNFSVAFVGSGREMDQYLERTKPDFLLLDLNLPGEDGLSLASRIRKTTALPLIIMSARGEDVDRIVGLEVGADDYLPKPFNTRELLARIRAVLRRTQPSRPSLQRKIFHFGPYTLDVDGHQLFKQDAEIALTSAEFSLLRVLVENPRRVLSRNKLMDLLKGREHAPFDRSIDVRVTRLRAKIEKDPSAPDFIRTVWGEGYLFTPDSKEA